MKTTESKMTGEKTITWTHSSGLKVIFVPKRDFSAKFAVLGVKYGSGDGCGYIDGKGNITPIPSGTAHFLEHKMFDKKEGSLLEAFSENGAFSNAATSVSSTKYYFKCVDRFEENLRILLDVVFNPFFSEKSVKKEKGIIAQELKMYDDSPWQVLSRNTFESMFYNNPARIDIGGTCGSIRKITAGDLYSCHRTFYAPENCVLSISGDIAVNVISDVLDGFFENSYADSREGSILQIIPFEEPSSVRKRKCLRHSDVNIPLFEIAFKDNAYTSDYRSFVRRLVCADAITDMLFGTSSEFYERVYNAGLINEQFGAGCDSNRCYKAVIFSGESSNPAKVLKEVRNTILKTAEKGILADELEKAKRASFGEALRRLVRPDQAAGFCCNAVMNGAEGLEYFETYDTIDKEFADNCFREIFCSDGDFGNCVISVLAPKNKEED